MLARAEGSRLYDVDGREFLDGNSSWWVAALGHRHPRLVRALCEQAEVLGHTSLAGVTHAPAALLARDICAIAPHGLTRAFFSDDGSTAVEAALKIAVQFFAQNGRPEKKRFVALDGAFHGDTAGAVSLGGVEIFRRCFGPLLFDVVRVASPAPDDDEGEEHAWQRAFADLEQILTDGAGEIAGVVVEPIVQGAAGMRSYDPRYLARLRELTLRLDVLLIADEVFTGYGRTGPMWACSHAAIAPDLLCTAKGFSGGLLPMAATLATERLYEGFSGGRGRAFLHGHSFTGNPLGAAVAREVLAIYRDEDVLGQVARKALVLRAAVEELRALPFVMRVRQIGMIAAADLATPTNEGYLGALGWRVYDEGLARGAYLRPLGDTVYLTPPLTISDEDLARLCSILIASVKAAMH